MGGVGGVFLLTNHGKKYQTTHLHNNIPYFMVTSFSSFLVTLIPVLYCFLFKVWSHIYKNGIGLDIFAITSYCKFYGNFLAMLLPVLYRFYLFFLFVWSRIYLKTASNGWFRQQHHTFYYTVTSRQPYIQFFTVCFFSCLFAFKYIYKNSYQYLQEKTYC